jgi:hypothetical protein
MSYSIKTPYESAPNAVTTNYNHQYYGYANTQARYINSVFYVPLEEAVNQLGAIYYKFDETIPYAQVFDYRISNSTTALSDPNNYVVGGKWLYNWTSVLNPMDDPNGAVQLSPHFKIRNFWDNDSGTTTVPCNYKYFRQMKIGVRQLQVAENVRYNGYGNTSMTINSGFRTWRHNRRFNYNDYKGGWGFHMRGRAFDTDGDIGATLYQLVYNEFLAGYSTPDPCGTLHYRNRHGDTHLYLFNGSEIEKMPDENGAYWLHIQTWPLCLSTGGP